jgi:hypothetical protein
MASISNPKLDTDAQTKSDNLPTFCKVCGQEFNSSEALSGDADRDMQRQILNHDCSAGF